jgi:glutamine synthetase
MSNDHQLTHYLVTDLGAITRGRGVWDAKGAPLKSGVGWVPVNQIISPFDTIASSNPWGSHGDCRLRTDPDTLVDITLPDGPDLRFALCDIADLDGADLTICARGFARRMVADLEAVGLRILSSFEQEYWLDMPGSGPATPGFSYQRAIRNEPFGADLMALLQQAGCAPEMLLAEFAADQFEMTMEPSFGIASADRAVVSREVVRAAVHHAGGSASFCPLRVAGGVGSGVHVHLSLWDRDGNPLLHDPEGLGGLTGLGQAFCAGIVWHMPALCALTASSVVSYERLQPHRWSSAYTCMGDRNREATLRICPVVTGGSTPIDHQFNVEYRAADATANPYLILGALIAAGLDGIRAGLGAPPLVNTDPSELPEADRTARGIERLPQSLGEALDRLEADDVLCAALGAPLVEAFLLAKRHEIEACDGLDADAVCARYAAIY